MGNWYFYFDVPAYKHHIKKHHLEEDEKMPDSLDKYCKNIAMHYINTECKLDIWLI